MLQSIPPRRGRFWLAGRSTIQAPAVSPARNTPNLTPKPGRRAGTVTRLPRGRAALSRAIARKLARKMQDEKGRAQLMRVFMLVLPVMLTLAVVATMALGWLAQAQASQSGNVGSQAEFQRQQMFHATVHVPQE